MMEFSLSLFFGRVYVVSTPMPIPMLMPKPMSMQNGNTNATGSANANANAVAILAPILGYHVAWLGRSTNTRTNFEHYLQ